MSTVRNWPNLLTFIRISLIPLLVIFYYLPIYGHLIAALLFAFAGLTDWLDGYLARSLQQATKLGAFLDPVADKLIVCIALVLIVGEPQFQFVSVDSRVMNIPAFFITVPAAIIVSRELIVSALREWMADLGKRAKVAVSYLGKVKTAVQIIALMILLYCDNGTNYLVVLIGYGLLYIAVVLTIWSMLIYLNMVWIESQS
ncbi:MAG TPA: CDP-diacylglycerol--glycerol-3-phosphate 3-phosphatidyltransferase [Gammaproteobacteria bacterium]|nr:CDP-diacylglycerol--glycerol-3-phosphate 3-phosphatidyltransferase [Gammaproteobacteria bacterium]